MRIAICDDEELHLMQLLTFLNDYASSHKNSDFSVTSFSSAEDLLETAKKINGFDIYILDIMMPDMNGIELGKQLRINNHDGIIIYLTSSREYAIDSYQTKAFYYLLKPIIPQELFSVLDDAFDTLSDRSEKSIIVKTKENSIRLPFDHILYAELCKRIIIYHLADGTTVESILLRIPFAQAIAALLADDRFILCGQSAAVNLSHITLVGSEEIEFKNAQKVYFSKKICREIRALWSDF